MGSYFQSYENYFWQWEEQGEVIAIPGASTIAYRNYIQELLEQLSPQGIPPFGSLLLVMIATNPNAESNLDVVYAILKEAIHTKEDVLLPEAISLLKMLAQIDAPYKEGIKRKLLIQALFENSHNQSAAKESASICHDFREKANAEHLYLKESFSLANFIKDFRTLSLLARRFRNTDEIIRKIASLPELKEELFIDKNENDSGNKTPDFTEHLITNPATFRTGALIKHIWSGLNIPAHSTQPSQQPLGGVSDLTNKGDFDKLLISEFANDDLVFMSRLANSEALYMHREIPPVSNDLKRIILLDTSLKNWGTPKIVAFATMLAIARHPKTDIPCSAFVVGRSFHPVSIDDINSIIEGLQLLETSLNAAEGLQAFFRAFPPDKKREIFFITEPSTLRQPDMIKVMLEYQPFISYLLHTGNEGQIDLFKQQKNSKKHLQHITLPLGELWEKAGKKSLENHKQSTQVSEYPILFMESISAKKIVSDPHEEIYMISSDKALFRLYNKTARWHEKGWELIMQNLPPVNGEIEMGAEENGDPVLLLFDPNKSEIHLINTRTNVRKNIAFQRQNTRRKEFFFHEKAFYHINHHEVSVIHPETGEIRRQHENMIPVYEKRISKIAELQKTFFSGTNILKNINEIYINSSSRLAFNKHDLAIKHNRIKLDLTKDKSRKLEAIKINEQEFEFEDGSSIETNRSGMLILKSSNTDIPYIYVPSVIDAPLGIATEDTFAGNEYYYKEPEFEIVLESAGHNPQLIKKILSEILSIDLTETEYIMDKVPVTIKSDIKVRLEQMRNRLEPNGAKLTVKQVSYSPDDMKIISTQDFYTRYIWQFIHTILNHGAKN